MQNQITECINKLMKSKGVTQNDLALELKCTQTAISNILNGKSRLTIDDLELISRKLGLTINELIVEASQYINLPKNIPDKIEEAITKNNLSFYLFNKLKIPIAIEEIFTELNANEFLRESILTAIKILQKNKIIEINEEGKIFLSIHTEKVLHYRLTDEYAKRIVEIYKNLRPIVSNVIKNEKKLLKWKERNLDAFYCEFFTEEQIKQQNDLQRQFLDLIKHQIRINSNPSDKHSIIKKELRVIYTVLAPFPIEDIHD